MTGTVEHEETSENTLTDVRWMRYVILVSSCSALTVICRRGLYEKGLAFITVPAVVAAASTISVGVVVLIL